MQHARPTNFPLCSGEEPTDRRVRRTRRQVLDATVTLMRERGLTGLTMDAIAEAADISRSTLYRHWPQLHDVVFDALHHLGDQMNEASAPPDRDGTPQECVLGGALAIGRFMRDDTWRALVAFLAVAAEHNADAALIYDRSASQCRTWVVDSIRDGQQAGNLPAALDADWATDLLLAPIYMNAIVLHRPMSDEQIAHHINSTLEIIAPHG